MNTIELMQYSLNNALGILSQVTDDLTQGQCDWMPPGIANPIGSLYWHAISVTDLVVHSWCMGQTPLSQSGGWQEKVLLAPETEEGGQAAEMREVRVNLPTLHEYAKVVQEAAQVWAASLTPAELERKLDTPSGEFKLGQAVELFVLWHINVHCGEISTLKGCQGATGYPF